MSKALIIKGAVFSTNKVETITIGDVVPCTGLSLDPSTISFTALGAIQEITATKTPANTTDALLWTSSNENVAIVSDGIVTCVGIGTATITAMCGTQTDICSVSCASISYNPKELYSVATGLKESGNQSDGRKYGSVSAYEYGALYYADSDPTGGYLAFYDNNSTSEGKYCIPIPKGATEISIESSIDALYISLNIYDVTNHAEKRDSSSRDWSALLVGMKNGTGSATLDISELTNANGYTFSMHRSSNPQESDLNAVATVTFT